MNYTAFFLTLIIGFAGAFLLGGIIPGAGTILAIAFIGGLILGHLPENDEKDADSSDSSDTDKE